MKLEAKVTFKGKVTETIDDSKRHAMLFAGAREIERHIVQEIDLQGLVKDGAFKDGVHIIPPIGNKVEIADSVKYGIHLEYGTRAHDITPKNKKALTIPRAGSKLVTRGGKTKSSFTFAGKTVIRNVLLRKKARHPGTRAYRPFTIGLIKSQRDVGKALKEHIHLNDDAN